MRLAPRRPEQTPSALRPLRSRLKSWLLLVRLDTFINHAVKAASLTRLRALRFGAPGPAALGIWSARLQPSGNGCRFADRASLGAIMATATASTGRLPRTLGLWSSVALVIGITIGSGIFRSPAAIAQKVPRSEEHTSE